MIVDFFSDTGEQPAKVPIQQPDYQQPFVDILSTFLSRGTLGPCPWSGVWGLGFGDWRRHPACSSLQGRYLLILLLLLLLTEVAAWNPIVPLCFTGRRRHGAVPGEFRQTLSSYHVHVYTLPLPTLGIRSGLAVDPAFSMLGRQSRAST